MAFNISSFITLEYINQTSHFLQLPKTFAGAGSHMTLEFLVSGHHAPASKKACLFIIIIITKSLENLSSDN